MREEEVLMVLEEGALPPVYGSEEAAGADVCAFLHDAVVIAPGTRSLIRTGIRVAIPQGFEIQVRPRSGLALGEGITVLNAPGTIDADFRGEIGVILINHGELPFKVLPQMRIAQLVLAPVCRAIYTKRGRLNTTLRGEKGFGHTGTDTPAQAMRHEPLSPHRGVERT